MSSEQPKHLETAVETLANYLESRSAAEFTRSTFSRRLLRSVSSASGRLLARRVLTMAASPLQRRKAGALSRQATLRLHLGSSINHLSEWINIDLMGDGADLVWDLTRPLPFPDGSVDAIFHEHVLEHLPLPTATSLMKDCQRVLKQGGVLRIGVPDAGAYLESYCNDGVFVSSNRPDRPTRLLAIQEVFFDHGHRSAYDFETLALLFEHTGFCSVEHRSFGDSRIQPCPDGEGRRAETLYVEAVR